MAQEAPVSFTVIAEGTDAVLAERKNYKIEDRAQLEQVWALAYGQTVTALPQVDLKKRMCSRYLEVKRIAVGTVWR